MQPEEIRELMRVKNWNTTKLAASLDMTASAVARWIDGSREPSGPASILMRMWLEDARQQNGKQLAEK